MVRAAVVFAALLFIAGLFALVAAPAESQQPPEYRWAITPAGIFADQRIQDAVGQLVDPNVVINRAGVSASLSYDGRGVNPSSTPQANARLLLAAAGFDDPPDQLVHQRRCRVWVLNAGLQPLASALGDEIAIGLKTIGVATEPCELVQAVEQADIIVWAAGDNRPSAGVRPEVPSFIGPPSRVPGPGGFTPPTTGDAGLRRYGRSGGQGPDCT